MRSGGSKRAGFSVELMVSNLQETVCKLIGAGHELDRMICLLGLGAMLDGLEMKKAYPIASWDS
jgi:hypothetical protein